MALRIVLDEGDFRDLVAGKAVTHRTAGQLQLVTEIALADIGWDRLLDALATAMVERGIAPDELRRILTPRYPRARPDHDDDD